MQPPTSLMMGAAIISAESDVDRCVRVCASVKQETIEASGDRELALSMPLIKSFATSSGWNILLSGDERRLLGPKILLASIGVAVSGG